jgi:O-Antigen ligase
VNKQKSRSTFKKADIISRPGTGTNISARVIWPLALAALVGSLYQGSQAHSLWLILGALFGILLFSEPTRKIRGVDWVVLALAAFEIAALQMSLYRANSMKLAMSLWLATLAFFVMRLTIWRPLQIAIFAGALGIGGAWLGCQGLERFADEAGRLTGAGFFNLVAFRSRLIVPPWPWIPGEWFTLVLLSLPFACALPLYLWRGGRYWPARITLVPPILVSAVLTLSLSRAVFWGTVLFYFAVCAFMFVSKVISLRTGVLSLLGAVGGLAVILACESVIFPGVFTTYAGRHSSQTRSTQGRVEIWKRSMGLVREHPLLGVGPSNSALMLLSSADDEETTGFASRTFSLPVQIVVEQGLVGLLLYAAFLILVAREFFRTIRPPEFVFAADERYVKADRVLAKGRNSASREVKNDAQAYKAMACCFGAGLVAVLFRELTYASIMEHTLTMILLSILAALVCQAEGHESHR